MAHILVRLISAPYGSSNAADGLDFAIGATNYGHDVSVIFEGDGVWQLHPNQQPAQGTKNQAKRLSAMPLFDIEDCYICHASLIERHLELQAIGIDVEPLDSNQRHALYAKVDHVVSF